MSLDSEADHHSDHECSTVDDEAYEPTYAEAFPPLPATSDTAYPLHDQAVSNKWIAAANRMAVRSSAITQVDGFVTEIIQYLTKIVQFVLNVSIELSFMTPCGGRIVLILNACDILFLTFTKLMITRRIEANDESTVD